MFIYSFTGSNFNFCCLRGLHVDVLLRDVNRWFDWRFCVKIYFTWLRQLFLASMVQCLLNEFKEFREYYQWSKREINAGKFEWWNLCTKGMAYGGWFKSCNYQQQEQNFGYLQMLFLPLEVRRHSLTWGPASYLKIECSSR